MAPSGSFFLPGFLLLPAGLWDHANMSQDRKDDAENVTPGSPAEVQSGPTVSHDNPTTAQMRTVGQRRREAEEKLEHHLEDARHKTEEEHKAEEQQE